MKILFTLLLLSATLAAQAPPAPPPQQSATVDAEIRHLLEVMGTAKMMMHVVDTMMDQQFAGISKLRPDIPQEFWTEFAAETRKQVHPEELVDLIVPIYAKHFTADEIRQLGVFYETPLGKKLIGELPQIQEEAMQVGQQWGEQLGRRLGAEVARKLIEKGYKLGTPPAPPEK